MYKKATESQPQSVLVAWQSKWIMYTELFEQIVNGVLVAWQSKWIMYIKVKDNVGGLGFSSLAKQMDNVPKEPELKFTQSFSSLAKQMDNVPS